VLRRGRKGNVVHGRFGGGRKPRWTDAGSYSPELPRARRLRGGWLAFVPLWCGAALVGTAYGAGWFDGFWKSAPVQAAADFAAGDRTMFSFCHVGAGYNCVVDGDTIWLKGEKIRIADIDAPETHDYQCASEKDLGDQATRRLEELMESGTITLRTIDRDEDSYGRKLRIVLVNGESVGAALVNEGLARYYGRGRQPWC